MMIVCTSSTVPPNQHTSFQADTNVIDGCVRTGKTSDDASLSDDLQPPGLSLYSLVLTIVGKPTSELATDLDWKDETYQVSLYNISSQSPLGIQLLY